jgi:N-acetylglucosaminyl-diphospho-decaprenol L-rhamnosyltransferase
MLDLAVIIVTWNVRDMALDAIRTVLDDMETSGLSGRVYVVDSASSDGTPDVIKAAFPQVDVYASEENLGFGRGNNHAIRRVLALEHPPKAVYLLNPDTLTKQGATRALFDALMNDPKCGLVGAQLEYEDGTFQHGAFHFPGLRQLWVEFFPIPGRLIDSGFNGRYSQSLYTSGTPFPVDFPLGATMMFKTNVIRQTGMFDESFFMYCEEVDWAWRIHQAGWQVMCVPSARVVHLSGQSTGQVPPRSFINLWESRLKLFRKYYPAWKFRLAKWMIIVGLRRKIHQAESLPEHQHEAMVSAYQHVMELART